jgi:hypothetical protein
MSIVFRPLNKVHEIMADVGYEPGYAYDDLVFSNDAVFIIQFDNEDESKLKLFINNDCIETEYTRLKTELNKKALQKEFNLIYSGKFTLSSKEESEEIEIAFN